MNIAIQGTLRTKIETRIAVKHNEFWLYINYQLDALIIIYS